MKSDRRPLSLTELAAKSAVRAIATPEDKDTPDKKLREFNNVSLDRRSLKQLILCFIKDAEVGQSTAITFKSGVVVSKECVINNMKGIKHPIYTINPEMPTGKRYKIIIIPNKDNSFLVYDAKYNFVFECPYKTPLDTQEAIIEFIQSGNPPKGYNPHEARLNTILNDICGIPRNMYTYIVDDGNAQCYLVEVFGDPCPAISDFYDLLDKYIPSAILVTIASILLLAGMPIIGILCISFRFNTVFKMMFDAPLAIADFTLEQMSMRIDNSTLHWAVKSIVQVPLHLALTLVVVSRLILHVVSAVLSPLKFLQSPLKWAQDTVYLIAPFRKKSIPSSSVAGNDASLWKQTKLPKEASMIPQPDDAQDQNRGNKSTPPPQFCHVTVWNPHRSP